MLLSDDAANCRRTKVQPRPTEHLGHALVAHRREEPFQLSDEVPDEVRVAVDRFYSLYQVSLPVLIEPAHPNLQRLQIDQKDPGGLLQSPTSGRAELEAARSSHEQHEQEAPWRHQ